jgi:hypothetical protein
MQQSNIRRAYRGVWAKQRTELVFGALEILSVNQNRNLGRGTRAPATGVGWFVADISIRTCLAILADEARDQFRIASGLLQGARALGCHAAGEFLGSASRLG